MSSMWWGFGSKHSVSTWASYVLQNVSCQNGVIGSSKFNYTRSRNQGWKQMILGTSIQNLTPTEKPTVDEKLVLCVVMNNLLLCFVGSDYFRNYLWFIAPAYHPPSEKSISTNLLDDMYSALKTDMNEILRTNLFRNIITDESENVSKDRIINMSVNTDCGTFHYCSEDISSMAFTAENIQNGL